MAEEYLDEHGKPTWFDADVWEFVIPEKHKKFLLKEARKTWKEWLEKHSARGREHPKAVAEELHWYYTGLPEGEEGAIPNTTLLDQGFGLGKEAWADFSEGQSAAQYLNLRELLGPPYPPTPHLNLCGELAVAAVLDRSLKEGLELFSQVTTSEPKDGNVWGPVTGAEILKNKNYTTWAHQLGHFFKEAGWDYVTRNAATDPQSPHDDSNDMDALLDENKSLVTLVNIDGSQDGKLRAVAESERKIAHWVTVLSIVPTRVGETLIRIYNPFQNREELYSWEYFKAAWSQTRGNSVRFHVVIATPPTEGDEDTEPDPDE